jgi:hypothetical protein
MHTLHFNEDEYWWKTVVTVYTLAVHCPPQRSFNRYGINMSGNSFAVTDCGNNLQDRWEQVKEIGESICAALSDEVAKIGLQEKALATAPWERAGFELQRDPASGQFSLVGHWKNANGQRVGNIVFHCDGSFFAEYDVIEPHPRDKRWFVEAVNAWGKNEIIKAELRLLPAVS